MRISFHDVDGRLMDVLDPLMGFFPEHTKNSRFYVDRNAQLTITNGFGQGQEISEMKEVGSKIVVIQHGRSISYLASIGRDFSQADLICVGGELEKKFLCERFPNTNIVATGLPIHDRLYNLPQERGDFIIAPTLTNYEYDFSEEELVFYYQQLPGIHHVIYKPHEYKQHSADVTHQSRIKVFPIDDHQQLLKNAKALIAYNAFLVVEASLCKVPVITWPQNRAAFYKGWHGFYDWDYENLGCQLNDIHYTKEQDQLAKTYKFDGKNTQRVFEEIQKIC